MTDAISILKASCAKLTTKVERLRTQLAAAETELAESETALRVLGRLGISPAVDGSAGEDGRGNSQAQVLAVLDAHEILAKTPKEVHQALVDKGVASISADNVRTILSRCASKGLVLSQGGGYWRATLYPQEKEEAVEKAPAPAPAEVSPYEAFGAPSPPRSAFDEAVDDEVQF